MTTYTFNASSTPQTIIEVPNEIRKYLKRVRVVNKDNSQPVTVELSCEYTSYDYMYNPHSKQKLIYVSYCPPKSIDENKVEIKKEILGRLIVRSDIDSNNVFIIVEVGD